MAARFIEDHQVCNLLIPVANVFDTGKTTDEIKMDRWDRCTFLVITGANDGDEPKFTVESCSDTSGTGNTAIGFDYTSTSGRSTITTRNLWADYASKTSTQHYSRDGSAANIMYAIDVNASQLSATAGVNHEYVRLVITESGSAGITGTVICILSEPRFAKDGKATVLG